MEILADILFGLGRADRVPDGKTTLDDPIAEQLRPEERERYKYPQVRVIPPGGPYFKMPWQKIHKVSKDQLNTGVTGQIRYRVSESNLYAFLFGIKKPFVHVMAYFVSLRQRIANFESKPDPLTPPLPTNAAPSQVPGGEMIGVSINDLRQNLRDLNEYVDNECRSAPARYGVVFDQVSSDISLAHASADQKIVQSGRAVEIETLKAQAEMAPIKSLADELVELHNAGPGVLASYLRNVRLVLLDKAQQIFVEVSR